MGTVINGGTATVFYGTNRKPACIIIVQDIIIPTSAVSYNPTRRLLWWWLIQLIFSAFSAIKNLHAFLRYMALPPTEKNIISPVPFRALKNLCYLS